MNIYPQNQLEVLRLENLENKIVMNDCGKIVLNHDEQVTFTDSSGLEYDVARKDWGILCDALLNGRLKLWS